MTIAIPTSEQAVELSKDARFALSTGATVRVTFRKTDGEITSRKITWNQTHIPFSQLPKYVRAQNPHYIGGWDIDKGGWIRFHEERIISWNEVLILRRD
jgi:hypothetical protein